MTIIRKENGWDIHVFDSFEENRKCIIIYRQTASEFFLINDVGAINNNVLLPSSFKPDYVELLELNNDRGILKLSSLQTNSRITGQNDGE